MGKARSAGIFYLLTFVTGFTALYVRGTIGMASGVVAAACYIAVTLLFYYIFKPVNPILSLLAAFISLVGCVVPRPGGFSSDSAAVVRSCIDPAVHRRAAGGRGSGAR